jgi:Leucine-rich repeat (LRR) protein
MRLPFQNQDSISHRLTTKPIVIPQYDEILFVRYYIYSEGVFPCTPFFKEEYMLKSTLLLVIVTVTIAFTQQDSVTAPASTSTDNAVVAADDSPIVRAILDQCGITDRGVSDVAVFENGRAVSLNLTNKDVVKDGFKAIPADIGKLVALRTLICENNSISAIPLELINCSQLSKLNLRSNAITEIPLEFGRMTSLVDLDMRNNRLESLPYTIGSIKSLQILRLWGNQLASIQASITLLPALKELYLKDNRLTTLPMDLIKMRSLTYIDVEGNKLCNVDPKMDSWLRIKDKSYRQGQKCW